MQEETESKKTTLDSSENGESEPTVQRVVGLTKDGIQYQVLEVDGEPFKLFNTDRPERLEEESFKEYKIRRRFLNQIKKQSLKGEQIWNSKRFGMYTEAKAKLLEQLLNAETPNKNGEEQ